MNRFVLVVFLFALLFSGCAKEEILEMEDNKALSRSGYVTEDFEQYTLSQDQLHTIFKETMDLKYREVIQLSLLLETFLNLNPSFKKLVYGVY